ncbi:amino acid permease-associated region [Vulcanisaeta moutnovskia 768-28]|uniref:Amino acid permease-associated region n=1 Tax=Vulcanisaeta moutnovskia (strain 768-28) TaxID=985053 RepID=F0QX42_VULM7|nr:amino acid permease [Vulcanisaeta moutnovskia]ADY02331.1 amino acid permease-associated region [Vulcanisaeta moutnovskia 768-28]
MSNPTGSGPKISTEKAETTDKQLRKALNVFDIAYLVIGAVIGSGWLFGSFYAASVSGPAAILSWTIAGIFLIFVALSFAELGGMIPKSGAIVRYPQYSHGSFASYIFAWAYLLGAITVPPVEAEAVVTYMSSYVPGLVTSTGVLTLTGGLIAFAFLTFFFLLNYFGVHVMGKTNTGVGWWKLIIPILTIALLLGLFFHPTNFTALPGGFTPYGWAPVFLAIPTTGIAFAYLGFRQGIEYGGEAKNPQRDLPWGTIIGFVICMAIYILLQVSFIGAIDWSKLSLKPGDWADLTSTALSSGPFYQIMKISGIPILMAFAIILLIDAMVSPSGTGWIYTGTSARTFYGMAADGHLPDWFLHLNRWKVPKWATIAAWLVGALFLIPYPAWVYLATFISSTTVTTYIITGASVVVLRRTAPNAPRPFKLPVAYLMGALAFIFAFLIPYWAGFTTYWGVFALILAGLPFFYMYTAANRFGIRRLNAAVLGIIYWIILGLSTWFLIYQDIIVPYNAASASGTALTFSMKYFTPFIIYWVLMLIVTVIFTYIIRMWANEEGKRHISSGWWAVAMLFSVLILDFVGPFSVWKSPPLPFPWDTVTAAIIALALFFWSVYSGILTKDLEIVLKEMGVIKEEK